MDIQFRQMMCVSMTNHQHIIKTDAQTHRVRQPTREGARDSVLLCIYMKKARKLDILDASSIVYNPPKYTIRIQIWISNVENSNFFQTYQTHSNVQCQASQKPRDLPWEVRRILHLDVLITLRIFFHFSWRFHRVTSPRVLESEYRLLHTLYLPSMYTKTRVQTIGSQYMFNMKIVQIVLARKKKNSPFSMRVSYLSERVCTRFEFRDLEFQFQDISQSLSPLTFHSTIIISNW